MTAIGLIVTLAFAQNVVFVDFLAVSRFEAAARSVRRAHHVAINVTLSMIVLATAYAALVRFVLRPIGLEYLELIVLAMLVGSGHVAYRRLAVALAPFSIHWVNEVGSLLAANATLFGVALVSAEYVYPFYLVPVAALAAGVGLYLALVPLAAIRRRLTVTGVPAPFAGEAVLFVSAGMIALVLAAIDQTLFVLFPPIW